MNSLSVSRSFATVVVLLALNVSGVQAQSIRTDDLGLESGFQDLLLGHHKRGRTSVAADFDLDGRTDFFIGNPGDESLIIRNTLDSGGVLGFELAQVLLTGDLAWAGSSADYDNDGDYDLYVSIAGLEGVGHDFLFRNEWIESGGTALSFTDVSLPAGIRGPIPIGFPGPIVTSSGNGVWADVDRDGDVDLFVSTRLAMASLPELKGRNTLWRNDGDGTFTDITQAVGLDVTAYSTQHSTFLDIDNDGDTDLFESNWGHPNVLWRNRLVETGDLLFEDVTDLFSPGTEDLSFPVLGFASAASDFNNDGWEDLIVFGKMGTTPEDLSPYAPGHAIFLNRSGVF